MNKMEFCAKIDGVTGPHPYLVWLALSYWGAVLVPFPCTNVILFNRVSTLGQTTSAVDTKNQVIWARIEINTDALRTNALVYNVMLHELGHAHGFHHSSGSDVMRFFLLASGSSVVQCIPYIGDTRRYIPFHPCSDVLYNASYNYIL